MYPNYSHCRSWLPALALLLISCHPGSHTAQKPDPMTSTPNLKDSASATLDSRSRTTPGEAESPAAQPQASQKPDAQGLRSLYLAGGCFWGTEHYFKQIDGVVATEAGYANGNTRNPTYEDVCSNETGFAETVHVQYDPAKVDLVFLLDMYFHAIDPTSLNQQGNDYGTQYRTGIYYVDAADEPIIGHFLAEQQKKVSGTICVEVLPLRNFYRAEEYHQNFLGKHPNGYCHLPRRLMEFARRAKPKR